MSAVRPAVLLRHEQDVLVGMPTSELPEVRWHVGLLIPRLRLDARQVPIAAEVLDRLLDDPSRIVQANALDGIVRSPTTTPGSLAWPARR